MSDYYAGPPWWPPGSGAKSWRRWRSGPSAARAASDAARVTSYTLPEKNPDVLHLTRITPRRLALQIGLFALTVASTCLIVSPYYSLCLMSILTAHEFGHYFAARHYGVPATLPFFIPAPSLFGTWGAVIRMSPFLPHRKALFDIAAAGPLAGAVLAVPISFVGVRLSTVGPVQPDSEGITLGDPLLFQAFRWIVFGTPQEGMVVVLHDVGFAGWVGLFVTALNLLPVGQLDGGHVSYAVFRSRSALIARATFAILLGVCLTLSPQYAVFLVLLLLLGIHHRPTQDDSIPLGRARRRLALILLLVFLLCFTPVPFEL